MHIPSPNPNLTTADVLDALRTSGKPFHEWGIAIDGTPMLAARAGGDKQPAIFITAGSHATEPAGVHAALNLLQVLDTEHEVHVLPLRDPLGFAGTNHCFSFAVGHEVEVPNHRAALDYLSNHGELIWREGELRVFKLGDIGFIWNTPMPGYDSFRSTHSHMLSLTRKDPNVLTQLWGTSVMLMCPMMGVEGCGEMQRCWHGVLSADGEWLHLNRFFGRDDAPPEVTAVDRLMQAVHPGLTCDLHEGNGKGFWMPLHMPDRIPEQVVVDMAKAYFDHIHSRSYPITTYEELATAEQAFPRGYPTGRNRPEPRVPGTLWSNVLRTGEGHNLGSYASLWGVGFDTEAPVKRPLDMRVDGITNGILAAVRVWEETA